MSSTTPAFEASRLPVTLTIDLRATPRGEKKSISLGQKSVITEYRTHMNPNEALGKVKVGHSARISEVYGPYSSHEVTVAIEIPVTLEELQEFEGIVEVFQDRCVAMNRRIFNDVLQSVGKDALFGTLPAAGTA